MEHPPVGVATSVGGRSSEQHFARPPHRRGVIFTVDGPVPDSFGMFCWDRHDGGFSGPLVSDK